MTIRTKPPKAKPQVQEHFTEIKKIGFRDRVACWCGSQAIKGSPDFQMWHREHRECEMRRREDE